MNTTHVSKHEPSAEVIAAHLELDSIARRIREADRLEYEAHNLRFEASELSSASIRRNLATAEARQVEFHAQRARR